MQDQYVTDKNQRGFMKDKLCLVLTMITGLVVQGEAMEIIYVDFGKAFDTVSRKSL